jgi:hypothetical protein
MTTNDEQRRCIEEARATVARIDRLTPRDETAQQEPSINRLDQWRSDVRRQEAEFNASRAARKADADAARAAEDADAWRSWVGSEITIAVRQVASGIGEVLRDELDRIGEQLAQRDAAISKLERELAQQAVTIARLELRVIQGEVDHDRSKVLDLPAWPQRKSVN